MKIFFFDFSTHEFVQTGYELQKNGVEILYWTGSKEIFEKASQDKKTFPNTIFHNQFDAVRGMAPEGIDDSKFYPPSSKLIEEMLECESISLTMMNRIDFSNSPLSQKKHMYYKYLQYWNGVLDFLKPDAIVLSEIPHVVYNYILYALAKKRGIPTFMPAVATGFIGWHVMVRDHKNFAEDILKEYEKISNEYHTIEDLSSDMRHFYKKWSDSKADATPLFNKKVYSKMNKGASFFPGIGAIRNSVKDGTIFKKILPFIRTKINLKNKKIFNFLENDNERYFDLAHLKEAEKIKESLKREYKDLEVRPDFSKKYIYFPLHLQPERSTSPMADFYVDMILLAKTVAAALPEGWMLYIKEYPSQWNKQNCRVHLCRYKGYYSELAKINNARLVPTETSAYDLINNAQAIATACGTTGFEGLARNKPVILFGHPWYMYCPGVFQVESSEDCRKAIGEIQKGFKPDSQKVLNYFLALDRVAIRTNQMAPLQPNPITSEQTVKNLTEAFLKELKLLRNNG
ncbi:MAG: hypothetical protein WC459_00660 [Patescibacteria group bacterium]